MLSLSSTKRKDGHGNRTPNSVATSIPADTSGGANTPLRNFVRCVKFGSASAAEFEKDDPPQGSLTPMPPTKAAQRFPTDFKEPDPETAELIAMTKENSATLAEWDFFDDGEGELVSDATRSPLENLRSRRESGRFTPFCESDPFERIEDEAFVMDTTETVAMYDDEIVEMDVGKTLEANVVRWMLWGEDANEVIRSYSIHLLSLRPRHKTG